ncbi:EAL domain-containing protein [Ancylobacter moscoviensis]
MRHWRVIGIAALLAVIGTAVPLAATLVLSWRMATAADEERLGRTADRVLGNTLDIYADAERTLQSIASTDFEPCSPRHIRRLRDLTVNSLATDNLSYVGGGTVQCNVWGLAETPFTHPPAEVSMPGGIRLGVNFSSDFNPRRLMMVLGLRGHTAMVDQTRFAAPLGHPQTRIEIFAPGGTPVQTAPAYLRPAAAPADEDHLVVRREANGWSVVATRPRQSFLDHLDAAKYALAPIALFLAALVAGLAVWLSRRRLSPRGELAQAVRNREFIAHYQPIVELATGRCVGAEALVRWRRPDGQIIRPDLFIPLAEDTGLIHPLTDRVIEGIVTDLGDLLRRDRLMHIAINLCAADLNSGRILPVLERRLAGTGIEPQQIWLEATERSFVDIERARATLAELHRRGHMTAIDDFGTGYSGLKYLERLPVDALKIDKSFIDVIGTEAPTRHVTDHIIAMARALKLRIVAEGVETHAQAAYLRRHKVEFAQGWLFARALPAEEFIAFCRHNRAAHGSPSNVITLAAE